MTKKQKYYTVWKGNNIGVFSNWKDCKYQIDGYKGAQYKSFETKAQAEEAFRNDYWLYVEKKTKTPKVKTNNNDLIIKESIAVDAACSGNPGDMEYRGVYIKNNKQIFIQGVFKEGTNNIGEFLAIVHGLALLKKENSSMPIYSDSATAISWVKNKKCKTKLEETVNNSNLFDLIDRAEQWLQNNEYSTIIYKWDTKNWGEIPADFGRK